MEGKDHPHPRLIRFLPECGSPGFFTELNRRSLLSHHAPDACVLTDDGDTCDIVQDRERCMNQKTGMFLYFR